jgi:malate dehydrogenase (oxaloacetate-decarboxylating)
LLPPVNELRNVAFAVAVAVARQARIDGVAGPSESGSLADHIRAQMWEPVYRPYRRVANGKDRAAEAARSNIQR